MTRSYLAKVRSVKDAIEKRIVGVSKTKKPRHVDRAIAGISYLYAKNKWGSFMKGEVMRAVRLMHENSGDTAELGKYIERYVENALPVLARAGYIQYDDHDGEKICIRKLAGDLFEKVNGEIEAITFESDSEKLRAMCDHFRQRIGTFTRPTIKSLEKELKTLYGEMKKLRAGFPPSPEAINSVDPPESTNNDIDMDEGPIAGPSSLPINNNYATPARRRGLSNPEDSYPTPESIPRWRDGRSSTPSSRLPTPFQVSVSSRNDEDMDIDDDSSGNVGSQNPHPPESRGIFEQFFENVTNYIPFPRLSFATRPSPEIIFQRFQNRSEINKAIQRYQVQRYEKTEQLLQIAYNVNNAKDIQLQDLTTQVETLKTELNLEQQLRKDAENQLLQHKQRLEIVQTENCALKNRLFHSRLQGQATLRKATNLERKLATAQRQNQDDTQNLVAQVRDLRLEISDTMQRFEDLVDVQLNRETVLNTEICRLEGELEEKTGELEEIRARNIDELLN